MRILYHHRIRSRDGQSVHLEELIHALRTDGHEVMVVGPAAFADASFGDDPKLLAAMKSLIPKPIYEVMELAYNVPAYFRILRACKSFKPDVIYERSNLYLLAGLWLRARSGIPLILEINAPLSSERSKFGGLAFPRTALWLEHWTWRNADFALPVTGVLADRVVAAGAHASRVVVIPNAIDPNRFSVAAHDPGQAKQELGLAGKLVLGFVGFVRDWHGLDRIIKALATPRLNAMHLIVVGEGPSIPSLRELATELGVIDRVLFAGLIDRDHVGNYVAAFDIALQPECVDYCSPLKLFEYMSLGKAIVAPDQANIREVLVADQTAILFDPQRPDDLVEAISRLAGDAGLRARLGAEARARIEKGGFSWRQNAERVASLARRALQRND